MPTGFVEPRFTGDLGSAREARTEAFFVLGALLVFLFETVLFAFFDGDTGHLYGGGVAVVRVAYRDGHQHIQPFHDLKAAGVAATKPPSAVALTPAMRDLLSGLDALLAHRGSPRRPSRAPLEHVLDPTVALGADERSTCLRAVHLLYATLYGGCVPDANEIAAVTASLAASRSAHA